MPEFDTYVDVDVDEFVSACSKREIKELIDSLIEDGHLNASAIPGNDKNIGVFESQFIEKLDGLKEKYYRLSQEDEKTLEDLFKKYLQGLIFRIFDYIYKNIMKNLNTLDRANLVPTNDGTGTLCERSDNK